MNSQIVVREIMSRKNSFKHMVKEGFASIVAYPQTSARDAARIMADINIDYSLYSQALGTKNS